MDKYNKGIERLLHDVTMAHIDSITQERLHCISAWRALEYRNGEDVTFFINGILRAITGQEVA